MKQQTTNQEIKKAMVEGLSLQNLSGQEQDAIVSKMLDNVSARINMAVWGLLSDEDKNQLVGMLRQGPQQTLDYINNKIEDFPGLVQNVTRQTMDEFRAKRAQMQKG